MARAKKTRAYLREGRKLSPDGRSSKLTTFKLLAPGDDMCAGHNAKFFRFQNPDKSHEISNVIFITAPGVWIVDIGKPLDFRRHVGQALELSACQKSLDIDEFVVLWRFSSSFLTSFRFFMRGQFSYDNVKRSIRRGEHQRGSILPDPFPP